MKRIAAAIVILLIVCALSILTGVYRRNQLNGLLNDTYKMQEALESGNQEACKKMANDFALRCEKAGQIMQLFIRHSDIAPLRDEASMLPELIESGSNELFFLGLLECRRAILKLDNQELPRIENIL